MRGLADKVSLVTGGASGFGKAIAQRLRDEGGTVVFTDVKRDHGRATAEELGVVFIEHDVTNEAGWPDVIGEVQERFGRLDILVNNAGIESSMDAIGPEHTPYSEWKRVHEVNLDGVFLGCRAGIPALRRAGGGSIVNISSIAALTAGADVLPYGSSKAAVRQLTKSVAQYCARESLKVRCNSVHPGVVRTPLWERYATEVAAKRGVTVDDIVAETTATVPLGELPLPQDIAAAVAFLCSDDARLITGTAVIVDGGYVECS